MTETNAFLFRLIFCVLKHVIPPSLSFFHRNLKSASTLITKYKASLLHRLLVLHNLKRMKESWFTTTEYKVYSKVYKE